MTDFNMKDDDYPKLTLKEIDIQIAGTRLFDYFRDLLIVAGQEVIFDDRYQAIRLQFGDSVVQLVKAIKESL